MIAGGYFLPTAVCAQDSAEEEARKKAEINEIKLSENTIYADVIEMVTDDNEAVSLAQQKSINMLQMHVIEMFAKRMNMPPEDVQEIWDVIDDKCQNIVVRKGDLFRVFTYIVKDAVGLGRRKPKKGDVEKYLTPSEEKDLADAQLTLNNMERELNEEDSVTVADSVAVADHANPADSVKLTAQADIKKPEMKKEEPKTITTVPVMTETPQNTEVKEEPKTVTAPVETGTPQVPELAKQLMLQKDMKTLIAYLNAEKEKQNLMYGNMKNMIYKEKCYIVIVNKNNKMIETVLGKGFDDRMNYKTMKTDDLDNYTNSNFSAVLVQEY